MRAGDQAAQPRSQHDREARVEKMAAASAFDSQFADLMGFSPFCWQKRLFQRFLDGDAPDGLDLPTGLGKTSVMAVWYLALKAGAKLPRRLVYAVDRRAVVHDRVSRDGVVVVAGWRNSHIRELGIDPAQLIRIATIDPPFTFCEQLREPRTKPTSEHT